MLRDPLPGQGPRRKSLKGGTFLDLPGPQRPVQDGPIDSQENPKAAQDAMGGLTQRARGESQKERIVETR